MTSTIEQDGSLTPEFKIGTVRCSLVGQMLVQQRSYVYKDRLSIKLKKAVELLMSGLLEKYVYGLLQVLRMGILV